MIELAKKHIPELAGVLGSSFGWVMGWFAGIWLDAYSYGEIVGNLSATFGALLALAALIYKVMQIREKLKKQRKDDRDGDT